MTSINSLPSPSGLRVGIGRWVAPQTFLRWTDRAPERYVVKAPLAPALLLTSSVDDCRAIFTEREGKLLFGEALRRFAPHEAMFGHDAISSLDGDDHQRFRRRLTGAFHGQALRAYEEVIVAQTEAALRDWPIGSPVRFAELTHRLARDVVVAAVFGVTDPARAKRLQNALDRLDKALDSLELGVRFAAAIVMRGWWAPYPNMRSIHTEIEAIAREEMTERRAAPTRSTADCLGRFLASEQADDTLSDDEIVVALRVLLVAGWGTTANTLAWMAERLARHPDALQACRDDALEGSGRYLTAAVQETLRVRPPVPVTLRYVSEDFDLNGLTVPAGTVVAADIERLHHRPDIYPDPRRFRPERFLEQRPGTYSWIPFGGGIHRCIGAGFALTEARLVMRTILRTLTFAPALPRGEASSRRTLITVPRDKAVVTLLAAELKPGRARTRSSAGPSRGPVVT
jgi:cytochrome P450